MAMKFLLIICTLLIYNIWTGVILDIYADGQNLQSSRLSHPSDEMIFIYIDYASPALVCNTMDSFKP